MAEMIMHSISGLCSELLKFFAEKFHNLPRIVKSKPNEIMNKLPIVIVISEGNISSTEIISKITKKSDSDHDSVILEPTLLGVKHHILTKYYENDILFVSYNKKPIAEFPEDFIDSVEGILIYFDADNKEFLKSLDVYAEFIERQEIEFGALLCQKLHDNESNGITYAQAKKFSKFLDVFELEVSLTNDRDNDDDEDNSDNVKHHNPIGYDELIQALENVLWSNAEMLKSIGNNNTSVNANDEQILTNMLDLSMNEGNSTGNPDELADFDKLLSEILMFRNATSTWSRQEKLAHAEKFARKIDNILGSDISSDED